jgi:hypothetical protein
MTSLADRLNPSRLMARRLHRPCYIAQLQSCACPREEGGVPIFLSTSGDNAPAAECALMEWSPAAGVWIGRSQADEADMSLRIAFALAVIITLAAVATASAAAKKQRVPRSGPQAQAVAPRTAAPFNPYNPALTGAGSPGYNQSLMTWR